MRLISTRKRRERARWFHPMLRITGGTLPPGMVLGFRGVWGVPHGDGTFRFTIRAATGPTDFRPTKKG